MKKLKSKINSKGANVAVIGLGYVGLPLAVSFALQGFKVMGIEQNRRRKKEINQCKNYIADVSDKELSRVVKQKKLKAYDDFKCLAKADVICICVPTPLDKNKQPNISYVRSVTDQIAKYLKKDQLIILESTTYPGTTEEIILPKLQTKGMQVGKDFFLAFSPERVDPGNKQFKTKDIPKVLGGVTPQCAELAKIFYGKIISNVHVVSSPRVAEMEKLLENVFRSVNIALVNELAILCKKMDINVWEVIDAAKTKPYGFMPFYPGPGIGGHCIPLDPFYLSWRAREFDITTRFIELAGEVNEKMPEYVVQLLQDGLNQNRQSLKGAKVLVLGVAYKKDIADWRESPALKIIEILKAKGAMVSYNDPFIPKVKINGKMHTSVKLNNKALQQSDCVLIATNHSQYDYENIVNRSGLVIDTRNATANVARPSARIIKI